MILVFNVGSSTLKYALFSADDDTQISRATIDVRDDADCDGAANKVLDEVDKAFGLANVRAIGHRLVHGGRRFRRAVVIDSTVRQSLGELISLAPNHLPLELRAVDTIARRSPHLTQVATFDTAFHSGMPVRARLFGLPRKVADAGVVRYGFHGLSYEYIVTTLQKAGDLPKRTIIAHLGNGASLAAVLDGKSVDTSMGMTPMGGVVMSKRAGDLDPGAVLFMLRALGFSGDDLERAVGKGGGLLGLSELDSDVRTLLHAQKTNSRAADALEVFVYQIRKFVGAYAAALGGLDLLVFTGGVGEHSAEIRGRICDNLGFLGIAVDDTRNRGNAETISSEVSKVRVAVIPTNEESMIAHHVRQTLSAAGMAR
ncbi:MAG TPA: acetate/propionate family kinase [Gemmatimonadaceae bacterium]|nr:acetate/propionate family kinase [Gemmatimonadaceae bacterium]